MDYFINRENQLTRLTNEYRKHKSLIVAYDFDNTVYDYHGVGYKFDKVTELLRECKELGFYLIVYTCNGEEKYKGIKKYSNNNKIPYDSINENAPFINFAYNKLYYNILLDDRAGLDSAYSTLKELINNIKNGEI